MALVLEGEKLLSCLLLIRTIVVGDGTIGGETIGGGGGGTRDASTEDEANRKEKNQKRKKCPAVHGRDHREMWCKPCIQSKKGTIYI